MVVSEDNAPARHLLLDPITPAAPPHSEKIALDSNAILKSNSSTTTSDNQSEIDAAMGQCYPKCMNDALDESSRLAPGTRAKRTSKPRTNLSALKQLPNDSDDVLALALETLDLEELATERIVTTLVPEAPASIVVDYEDALDADDEQQTQIHQTPMSTPRRSRQNSIADCARDACGPLGKASVHAPAADDSLFDLKTAPLTPGRRRSSRNDSSSKTLVFEPLDAAKHRSFEPASPLTDSTAESDDDERCTRAPKLCLCEVKRHKTRDSCWLVAGMQVYDVTGIVDVHPGGARSLLRKAGGPDCTQDMKFHTKNARKMLEQCFIGKLQPCGDVQERPDTNCSIM